MGPKVGGKWRTSTLLLRNPNSALEDVSHLGNRDTSRGSAPRRRAREQWPFTRTETTSPNLSQASLTRRIRPARQPHTLVSIGARIAAGRMPATRAIPFHRRTTLSTTPTTVLFAGN